MTPFPDTACRDADRTRLYRSVLAELPKGVTIVATLGDDGPVGSTASAVTSLSLNPLLVLVNLAQHSRTLIHLRQRGTFSINILRDGHSQLAKSFAVRQPYEDRFATVAHHIDHDTAVLDDALAWVTCRLHETYPGGDHVIVVGEVTGMHRGGGEPLVWHRGGYRRVADSIDEPTDAAPARSDDTYYSSPGARH